MLFDEILHKFRFEKVELYILRVENVYYPFPEKGILSHTQLMCQCLHRIGEGKYLKEFGQILSIIKKYLCDHGNTKTCVILNLP
jgi:hypothetical protein